MSTARYLLGVSLIGLALGPVTFASFRWCRVLLPRWCRAPVALATIVVVLSALVCTEELLGAFGVLRPIATTVTLAALGVGGCLIERRYRARGAVAVSDRGLALPRAETAEKSDLSVQGPLWVQLVALGAVSLLAADWFTRAVDALHHGMSTPDTLWYHMPVAARFAQQGAITPLHFIDPGIDIGSVIPFYPANGELVHTFGILVVGNDFLSVLLNLGWLTLALLAAWCVGRPYGVAPITLTGCAALMVAPGLVATQPGGAYTDVTGLALVTSAAALLVNGERHPGQSAATGIAALAAGLALGTKFTFVAPVVALTVGVWFVTPRGLRVRTGLWWAGLALLTGGFWYGRNVEAIGNPLPSSLRLGPLHLMGPPQPASSNVASFVFERGTWVHWYLPGLRASLGPVWWATLALSLGGLVVGSLVATSPVRRMLALVGVFAAVAFVFTPQLLTLPPFYPHVPYNFAFNLRYSFAAVLLGLVLLPTNSLFRRRRNRNTLLGGYALIVVLTQFDSTIWPIDLLSERFGQAVVGVDSFIGLLVGIVIFTIGAGTTVVRSRRITSGPKQRRRVVVVTAVAVIVLGSAFAAERLYLRDRYQAVPPLAPLYAWAQNISDARFAMIGPFSNITYPLYGRDDSNYVQAVGVSGPDGSFNHAGNCRQFRLAVDDDRVNYVVTVVKSGDPNSGETNATAWTASDKSSRLVFRRVNTELNVTTSVFRLNGPLNPGQCLQT